MNCASGEAMPDISALLQSPTIDAIETAVQKQKAEPRRTYLGASVVGKPCERSLWYDFRWAHEPEQHEGRILRLFETGHVEEARMIGWLRLSGCDVLDCDPETGDQFGIVEIDGHFRGHLDGIVEGLREAPKTPHLLECKTHNAKSFGQLVRHGVGEAKPEHLAQMQIYMHYKSLTRAVYMAKCKDDDRLYIERIHYDLAHATALIIKAERIIRADVPPARVADDPDSFLCKFCASRDLCHFGAWPLRNCRTCGHSRPAENSGWWCDRHKMGLDRATQEAGCANHLYIPELVPGVQTDADPDAETITYELPDGSAWVDGEARS